MILTLQKKLKHWFVCLDSVYGKQGATKKKSIATLIMFVYIAIFVITTLYATDQDNVITVGYSETLNDFIINIDSRNDKGYGYELFEKMEEMSGIQFEYVPIEGSLIDAAEQGIVDLVGFVAKNEEREKRVLYSKFPFSRTYSALLSNNQNDFYNDYEKLNGKTVATYPDNIAQSYLDRHLEKYTISVDYIYGTTNNYMNLDTDYYISYSQHDGVKGKNNVFNLGVHYLYMASNFENAGKIKIIDDMLYTIAYTEGNFMMELEQKYIGANIEINHRALSIDEVEKLQERTLEVGYIEDYQPISYTNEQGKADGAMVDTLNLFSEIYGFKVNYHPYSLLDTPGLHKDFDILLTLYGDDEFDWEYYDATEDYFELPMFAQVHLDVHKNSSSLKEILDASPKIGMLPYQSVDYDAFLRGMPKNEIIFYNTFDALLDAFIDREIDIVVGTESSTTYADLYLHDMDNATIMTDFMVPMYFFISKKISSEYLPIFNILFDTVPESEYRVILNNNANTFYPKTTWLDVLFDRWYLFVILLILILFIFLAFEYFQSKKKREEITNVYNIDSLTGLMSQPYFREKAAELLANAKGNEYEVISLDIDLFRNINSYFGVDKGTEVIKAFACALKNALKNIDALIMRRNAEQFVVIKKAQIGIPLNEMYYGFLLPSVRSIIGFNYNVSMSFGRYVISNSDEKLNTVLAYAEEAKLHGKKLHNTSFITFDEKMKIKYESSLDVTFRMHQAIADKEFVAFYQPKINFNSLRIGGAEALVRWFPKTGGIIYPDAFIPVFEKNGFIVELDMYVLEEVCTFIKEHKKKMAIPRISVNLSALTATNENLISRITDIVEKHSIDPSEIEFEITESAIETNKTLFLSHVKVLKSFGFAISIDDFGAGVSSLHRITAIDADTLKLDKAFFDLKNQDKKNSIVVENVISMAKNLNMNIVAEGVETAEQAKWLQRLNSEYAQGYYFERPIDEDSFKTLLLENKKYEITIAE